MKRSLVFLLIVPFSLFGENLLQLIELSKNNKMIDSSRIGIESTKDTYESVKSSYMPQINLGANYRYNTKETSGMPEQAASVQGSLDYIIYDGGKKANRFDYYDSTIKSSGQSLENLKNQIALQVINYYYNYLSYIAQKETKLQEIEQLQAQYSRLKKFLDAGTITEDEVQKIISNIEIANVELHELELNIQTITHNLEYILGQSVTIQNGSTVKEYESKELKLRADIKALEYQLEALKSNAKATKSTKFPTLSFNDTLSYSDNNYDSGGSLSAASDDYERNLATINLSWNIFDFGVTDKSYEAAYKQYLSLKSQYEYEKNKADVDLKLAKRAYEIGKLKIESAKAGLKAANTAYELIKAQYENGIVDNIAYLESLTEKYSAESSLKVALYDLEVRKANIIYYSGETLEEYIK